ncbi:MAG: 1,2-phenylacetyl-CoA epoxidase subunit PaaC [Actinomycetes bacterium]
MSSLTASESAARATYALRLGDDALVLSHRLAEWCANGPEIEEDIALTNIALDLLGQARSLLTYAGECEGAATGTARSEDDLAYLRDERDITNLQIVELPNGDFARTVVRQLFVSTYLHALYARLVDSRDETLAAVAAKAVKEVAYHREHAGAWTVRLGDGTEESHRRTQEAVDWLWPYVDEMFRSDGLEQSLVEAGVAVDVGTLRDAWAEQVARVLEEATLTLPDGTWTAPGGGRTGLHTEHLGYLLAEMQHLHRAHPGATW